MNYDERDMTDAGVRLRFHRNEAACAPPEHVVRAVQSLDGEALRTYPVDAQAKLIRTLADRFGVGSESVVLGNGADELLLALGRAFLAPGDDALLLKPTFGMYERSVRLAAGVPRTQQYERRWSFDAQALIERATPRTRLVILGNPNNPTGDALDAGALARIAEALPYATVAVDEVYLAFSERSLASAVARYDNVVVLASLSKTAGLAGLRVGFAVAERRRAAALRRCIAPYPLSVASIVAAQAYLDNAEATRAYETLLSQQVERSLDRIVAALAPRTRACWRGAANFALFDFGERAGEIVAGLAERGIAVRTFDDPALAGMVRICAGGDSETRELVDALR
jgi:histidinol-phosphate aminotransferase